MFEIRYHRQKLLLLLVTLNLFVFVAVPAEYLGCFFILLLGSLAYWSMSMTNDMNHCRRCGAEVSRREMQQNTQREITAFSESTQAVTSLNPVLGVGSAGQGASIGIGAMQSTSHIPVKLASYQCNVKCPKCGHKFYWSYNGKVRIWTSVEGVETVEDLEEISYPFKTVK